MPLTACFWRYSPNKTDGECKKGGSNQHVGCDHELAKKDVKDL